MRLIPDKFIDLVNILSKYQQQLLVYTNHKGQLIGDGDGNITGVDEDGDENEAPINIENENRLDYQQELYLNQEDQTIQQPVKVELDTLEEGHNSIEQVPELIAPHTFQEYMQPERQTKSQECASLQE